MGSFDYTCAVSGLSIGHGEPVRFGLLTQNPYYRPARSTCHPWDVWHPRTVPLRARYNDYGSVEAIEESVGMQIWDLGFSIDLVRRGHGANTVHDVPVRRGMNTFQLLRALPEGRVHVKRDFPWPRGGSTVDDRIEKSNEEVEAQGSQTFLYPTLKTVERVLTAAGVPVVTEGEGFGGPEGSVTLTLERLGSVLIRCADSKNHVAFLGDLQDHLTQFATVVTAGYGQSPALLVRPHAGLIAVPPRRTKPLAVAQYMIREDVYQALVATKRPTWSQEVWTAERAFEDIRAAYIKCLTIPPSRWYRADTAKKGYASVLKFDMHTTSLGLATTFDLVVRKLKLDVETATPWLKDLADFVHVTCVLHSLRFQWQPGTNTGPQAGEWAEHLEFQKALVAICQAKVDAQKDD